LRALRNRRVRHRQTGSDEEETNAKSDCIEGVQPTSQPRSAGNLANDFRLVSAPWPTNPNTDGYDPQSETSSGTMPAGCSGDPQELG
jgi:hypothetical protein